MKIKYREGQKQNYLTRIADTIIGSEKVDITAQ